MDAKREYNIGDSVWIHGIRQGQLTEGRVVKTFTLEDSGYHPDMIFYVVEIPTSVDPLLEIRTWETISQDDKGPIGAWRRSELDVSSIGKYFRSLGVDIKLDAVNPEISDEAAKPRRHRKRRK